LVIVFVRREWGAGGHSDCGKVHFEKPCRKTTVANSGWLWPISGAEALEVVERSGGGIV